MKKQNIQPLASRLAALLVLLLTLSPRLVQAQDLSGTYTFDEDQKIQKITVPSGYQYLYLEAKGADGGTNSKGDFSGGEGARVSGYVSIGDGAGEIPAGSRLRLIPGQAGGVAYDYCGGGGGSGVAFKGPASNDGWQLLLVAGGGGGSGKTNGKAATAYSYGLDGNKSNGENQGNRGENGNGGSHRGAQAYPGGGAFSDGGGGYPGLAGFKNNVPVGGEGGSAPSNVGITLVRGGFGFGGGGSGVGLYPGGGGGGGYSGGGGGYTDTYNDGSGSKNGGGGGGGGSYANPDWVFIELLTNFATVTDPQDGYISYRFTNTSPFKTIQLAKDQTKCIDLTNGNTAKGTNIQLVQCKDNPAQQWVIRGATVRLAKNVKKCIDLTSSNTADGTNIQLWDCNGTDAQNWIYDVANRMIRSKLDFSKCLDLVNGNTTGGTNIQLYDCVYGNNQPNQQWVVDGVPSALPTAADQRIHVVAAPDKCLDVSNYNTANGTNIQLTECKEHPAQYFTFDDRAIKLQAYPDKCLDLSLSKTDNGKNIQLYDCNGTDAQNWIYDGFTKAFRSAIDLNKCLDVKESNFSNATNIQLWDCNGTAAQQFEIY